MLGHGRFTDAQNVADALAMTLEREDTLAPA
jgi:hypothetical protein